MPGCGAQAKEISPHISELNSDTGMLGSFVNVEPGIFVPGVGSACIENTLYVTDDGVVPLNEFGIEIHVV